MDPNLYRLFASGVFPSPLPSPQESMPMVFPSPMFPPQPMQQELLRQMVCQQLIYQQTLNNLLAPMTTPTPLPKAISPVMSMACLQPPTPCLQPIQQLTLPTKPCSPIVEVPQLPQLPQLPISTVPPQMTTTGPPAVISASRHSRQSQPRSSESPEAHCLSPSTSATTKDDDEDLFVDVESVDNKLANKDRRKAHVEFFRKVKSIRQRSVVDANGERSLKCAICEDMVPLQDNALQLHVNLHADAGGFRCQLCGFELKEKFKVYKHMRDKHPSKADLIEDRRNMSKLSAYIEVVFPRAYVRPKKDSTKEVESLLRQLEEKKITEVSCALCDRMVVSSRTCITRHANTHPSYRCKTCKFTTDSEKAQEQHQTEAHSVASPRLTGEYNLCTATDVVSKQISRCFSHSIE